MAGVTRTAAAPDTSTPSTARHPTDLKAPIRAGESWQRLDTATVAALVLMGLALRLPLLARSLWRDEGSTYFDITGSLAQLWNNVWAHEWTPPLYFIFEHGWIKLAGSGETALRLPSLAFGLATIVVVYAIGLRSCARLTAAIAGLIAAMAPVAVSLGVEARAYALTTFLAACALYAFLSVEHADTPRKRRLFALGFVLAATLLVCTHFTGYVVLGAFTIAAFVRVWRHPDEGNRLLVGAVAMALLLTLPVGGLFLHDARQQVTWQDQHQRRVLPLIDEQLAVFGPFGAMSVQVDRIVEIGVAIWAVALARSRSLGTAAAPAALLAFVVVSGIAVSVARGLPGGQHLAVYAPFAWLLFAMLLNACITWLRRPRPSRAGTIARVFVSLPLAYVIIGGMAVYPRSYREIREPISGAAALATALRTSTHRSVLLVACPDYLGPSLKYYMRGSGDEVRGIVTWKQPWFYSVDPAPWKARDLIGRLIARIGSDARRRHALIALAVDWSVPSYNGIDFDIAHALARREMRSHRVLWRRRFPGSQEPIDLIVLDGRLRRSPLVLRSAAHRVERHPRGRPSMRG